MKSAVLVDKKKFEVLDVEESKVKDGYIVIDVKKAGICGSDIHYWDVGEPKGLVLGHEFCGVVSDNNGNKDFNIGDRVTALPISPCGKCEACLTGNPQCCRQTWTYASGLSLDNPGAYAPKMNVRMDMVYKVPDNVSDEEMAMVEPSAVAMHAVNLANIKLGSKVLVIGGGVIGLLSCMFAKKAGASYVAVSEVNLSRGKKAIKLGVAEKFYDATNPDLIKTLMADTLGGFDVVIECCGNSAAVTSAITAVKPGGTVVLVGVSLTPVNVPLVMAVMGEMTLKGAIAYTKEEFKSCIDMIGRREIDVSRFIDDIVSLKDVQKAYERLTNGEDSAIKILVDPNI